MKRILKFAAMLIAFLSLGGIGYAITVIGDGEIDDAGLRWEGFQIAEDGTLRGFLINDSSKALRDLTLDMYTTNAQETQIYWRKTIKVGDMGPGEKRQVKEAYKPAKEAASKIKVMFKIPHKSNFRN